MKKTLLLFATLLCFIVSFEQARHIHKITVANFQFSPSTLNAKLGDTILWVWKSGGHTTTSLTVPLNARTWDAPIDATHKRFGYIITKKGTYTFECKIHPTSMQGTINVSQPLAAGLSDIKINAENASAVLNWHVNSNNDVAYFSVQRSIDGNNFSEIARIKPAGLTTYSYKDESAFTGKYIYYQVELTDKKGNTELSEIKMFASTQTASKIITSIDPNPVSSSGHLMLQFNADGNSNMRVQLFTESGKLVNQTNMAAVKGLNNGHMHLDNLTPGNYYILCTLGNKTEKHIVVVQ